MTESIRQRRFDLLVFDWDGTLYDSTAVIAHSIQAACLDLGCPVPDVSTALGVIGLGLLDALKQVVPDLPAARYPELGERYRHHYFEREHAVTLFKGTVEFLRWCRSQGYMLAIATGKSRQGLDQALTSVWGLKTLFDATRTADETAGKPSPQMLLELMQELDTPPEYTLMIGDTTHDVQMAVNAGVRSLGVGQGAHDSEQLEAFRGTQALQDVVHSIAQMQQWIASHG